jgi:hypothetical protein
MSALIERGAALSPEREVLIQRLAPTLSCMAQFVVVWLGARSPAANRQLQVQSQ